jgi:hypothetical protein
MDLSFAQGVIAMFQQYQPWIEKVGGALVSQGLKELWEQIKAKLGHSATDKIETKPDDAGQWEILKAKLLVALDEDPAFLEKIRELAARSEKEVASISQQATGDNTKQVAVNKSQNVKISVK